MRFYESKLTFDPIPKIHYMYTWDFAYRQARKSEWIRIAADRERFKQRILKFEEEFKKVKRNK